MSFLLLWSNGTVCIAVESITDVYFGMHIHNADSGTRWPDVPFGSWRLWDANVSWRNVQPTRERWDFSRLDVDVAMARIAHAELLLPLGLTPQWASSRPYERSSYSPGNAAEPLSISDWNNYVEVVARRYKGRISVYEIWNEPDDPGFFSGDISTLVQLTCNAYRIIKQVDPSAILVSPSASHLSKGIDWFDKFVERGGKGCFDVVGFHFYTLAHEPPEMIVPLAKQLRGVMKKNGIELLPVWNTESGWYIANTHRPISVPWHVLDDKTASAYVARALALGWAEGIRRFYWYAWDDGDLGLFDVQEKAPKPAARAYAQTISWLRGATSVNCSNASSNPTICELSFGENRRWMVWSSKDIDFKVPSAWQVSEFETISGEKFEVKPGVPFKLDISPVIFGMQMH